jgi:hypothetical protein
MEAKNPIPPRNMAIIIASATVGICFTLFILSRAGFPRHLLLIVAILTILFAGMAIAIGVHSGKKRAPLEKRLTEHDPKTFQQITNWGMAILLVGGLLQLFGHTLIGLIWIVVGGGVTWKKEWGRWFFMAVACFHLIAIALAFLSGNVSRLLVARHLEQYAMVIYGVAALFAIFLAWNLYFFSRPRVRDAFKFAAKAPTSSPAPANPTV